MLGNIKHHKKIYLTWKGIILFFFLVLTAHAFPQGYYFRNFKAENGLAQSYIYSIMQDSKGYLWVGTGNGLSRYDGFIFENFTTGDSLADNFVTCSISNGDLLWFGHMNGRLSCYDGKKFYEVKLPKQDGGPVTHFAKSPDGRVWLSTYSDGLIKLGKESGGLKQNSFAEPISIVTFEFLNDNEFIVGTNTGLFFCSLKEDDLPEVIGRIVEIPESKVMCIQKMRNKPGFYIATENDGIFQLFYEDRHFTVSALIADPEIEFTGIQDIYEDSRSNIWMGSFINGLIKISYSASGDSSSINYFNKAGGFPANNVKTIYEDREGIIWSGNYGEGLTQITPKAFSVSTFDKQIYGNNIFSIYIDQKYRWIGTENGLLKMDRLTGEIRKFYGIEGGLPKDTVTTVYSTDGKELWIGTGKNGVFRMEAGNERIHKFPLGNGVLENSITSITGKKEQVWIGTKKGLCNFNSNTGRTKWYTINQGGLPHNVINCLHIDTLARLWVSTHSNTLGWIQNEKVNKIPLFSATGNLTLGPITEDSYSRIWVGSNGNGVFMIEADSVANITTKEGLLSDYCYSIISDDRNNIWVGHKSGLSKIRTTDFSVKPIQQFEKATDNYQFNSNAIIKDQQGKIWFGSDKGLISYDPAIDSSGKLPPLLGITSVKINDEEIDNTETITLSPGNYKIKIDFLGISLKDPALVTYQYKLDGYDQVPEISKIPSAIYKNVSEGDYTFTLNSSSGDGIISEKPLILNIIINKPVWKKWWFYFVIVIILFSLIYSYIKRREYIFIAEKRILEEKVKERTYEIQCQKNEIELQKNLIDEKNASITSSIRYARHIQDAVLPSIELMDRLIPDNFILSIPKDIVSGDFYWMTEKDNKIILTVADCTGHGVPGAFMSLLGITLLNEIVNIQGVTRSDTIVEKLREYIILCLQQTRKNITTHDGMDISLCVVDMDRNKIQFTGGMNNLVFIRDGNLEIVKADYLSVCFVEDNFDSFTMKEFDYRKGDAFYLFSDGYQDQFGGIGDKKYLYRRFYSVLLDMVGLPMKDQKDVLEKNFYNWKKDTVQTDDITVVGIRL